MLQIVSYDLALPHRFIRLTEPPYQHQQLLVTLVLPQTLQNPFKHNHTKKKQVKTCCCCFERTIFMKAQFCRTTLKRIWQQKGVNPSGQSESRHRDVPCRQLVNCRASSPTNRPIFYPLRTFSVRSHQIYLKTIRWKSFPRTGSPQHRG